jgi:hypothetical protein
MWEDQPTWILRQAGARADTGTKAAEAVTLPGYILMGSIAGAEALGEAYNTLNEYAATHPEELVKAAKWLPWIIGLEEIGRRYKFGPGNPAPIGLPKWVTLQSVRSAIPEFAANK